jgi:two-component system, NarL family, invasion response regulator UvrY
MAKKKIVLVDDHVLVRNGLKELIERLGSYEVVAQFDSGVDFLNVIREENEYDLVLMDLNMPVLNGDEVVHKMKQDGIVVPVLILTLNSEENTIIKLFRDGVKGFLKKDCSALELKAALESIFNGGYHYNEFLTLSLRNDSDLPKPNEKDKILEELSPREREFLRLVCDANEFTYEQIADNMGVTARTVDGVREVLFDKFGIKSKTGLVLFVLRNDLLGVL